MMDHMWGWGYWGWAGGLMCIVVIAAIVLLIVWAVRAGSSGAGGPADKGQTPLDILKERYARGEIDEEEFERRKRGLR